MLHSSFVRFVYRPFRPLRIQYLSNKEKVRFKRLLQPSDVFIVGHPKSGNTLVAYMLAIILYKDRQNSINLENLGGFIPQVHYEDHSIGRYGDLSEPRLFRNEAPLYPALYPKTIYLVRDPRAVLISYYHMYCTIFDDKNTSLQDFVEEYLMHGCIRRYEPQIERWDKQVLAWESRSKNSKEVIIVKYEDIVDNKQAVLKRILEFTGIPFNEEYFSLAVERSSFCAMRKTEEAHGVSAYPGEIGKRGHFIRKGTKDGWKEEMTKEIANLIEYEFSEAMGKMGYR